MIRNVPDLQGLRKECRAWRNLKHLLNCNRKSTVGQVQPNLSLQHAAEALHISLLKSARFTT